MAITESQHPQVDSAEDETYLYHHFEDLQQQHETSSLGMWAFLATEVLFFGGVFAAFAYYQSIFPEAFKEASHHLNIPLGAFNTAILLCSSLTMALAVRASQLRQRKQTVWFLLGTIALGSVFLGIKFYEWSIEYRDGLVPGLNFDFSQVEHRQEVIFWSLYFTATGLHAIHMIIGIAIIAIMAVLVWRRWMTGTGSTQVEMLGLYWHLVDIVWVFLFPVLYLINH
ncbi:cytochrome c oxidase subunit 3 family protein [soil metagenome]